MDVHRQRVVASQIWPQLDLGCLVAQNLFRYETENVGTPMLGVRDFAATPSIGWCNENAPHNASDPEVEILGVCAGSEMARGRQVCEARFHPKRTTQVTVAGLWRVLWAQMA